MRETAMVTRKVGRGLWTRRNGRASVHASRRPKLSDRRI